MKLFFEVLKDKNEPLFYFGFLCLIGAIICLVLTKTTSIQVWGTSAWYKPFKFFLSTTIFVWSMAWFMQYLEPSNAIVMYSWGLIVLFGFENAYIIVQAGKGELSHFNVSTPVYSFLYNMMAIAAAGISFWTAYIGILFFQQSFPNIPDYYVWGIRLGIILFFLFSLEGFAMGSRLTHTIGGPDGSEGLPVVNWSKKYGDLRIAHFFGMHALQVIPILSFYLIRNVKGVFIVSLIYGIIALGLFLQALAGKPLIRF